MRPSCSSKVQSKNDNVQAFDTKWDEVSSAVNDRPTDNILVILTRENLHKAEELKDVLQVDAQETTFADKRYDCCSAKWPTDISGGTSTCLISNRAIETRTDLP